MIEVADTSRETDLGAKLELYARAGIPEFWIVDLTTDGVLVCRNPGGDRYGAMTRVEPSGILDVEGPPRSQDTGSFAVRVAWQRLPTCHIAVAGNR